MKVPLLARYNGTVKKSYEFVKENINKFPVNLFDLIKKFEWGLLTYEQMALNNNCTIEDICECLGSDGYSIYNGQNYTIAYNNQKQQQRINFTLAHEIGHIILNHHRDFDVTTVLKDNFTKEEYRILENEANCFARNLLAPAPLSQKVPFLFRYLKLADIFDISFLAQNTRMSFLKNDLNYLTTEEILSMQQKYEYYLLCGNCNTKYINKNSKFCPICGHSRLKKGNGLIMKDYKELNIKDIGICPICGNWDIQNDDNYCKICGLSLKNVCTNCEMELDGSARFCTNCGCISTYYKNKILKSWEVENFNYNISNIDLEKIWQNYTSYLKSCGKIVMYTNLMHTNLLFLAENTVGINFINGITNFGYAVLNKKENIEELKKHISMFVGKDIRIKFLNNGKEFEDTDTTDSYVQNADLPFKIVE